MVGLIGAGLLGSALAERMLGRGMQVLAYDLDSDRLAAVRALGGRAATSASEVATACQRIVLSLPTSDVATAVLAEIGPALSAGTVIIDTTTGEPEETAIRGAELHRRGIDYLDATVSGSSADARAGKAVVMAGGRAEVFVACLDIFDGFAERSFHVGPWGSGAAMKLVTNLVLGLNRAALAEGFSLAQALGLDLGQSLAVLQSSAAYSRAMDAKGRKMIQQDFAPQARLAQHLKDVLLMLAAAERTGATLPLSVVHRELLERLVAEGFGEEDNSAIIRAFGKPTTLARRGDGQSDDEDGA